MATPAGSSSLLSASERMKQLTVPDPDQPSFSASSLTTTTTTTASSSLSSTPSLPPPLPPRKLPLPFFRLRSIGLGGGWVERHGNLVRYPRAGVQVLGVIHFLGGAFAGAAPQIFYKFLLEALADEGYVIVATPFHLQLNYLTLCDEVLAKFDKVAVELAQEYGALPVIGLGHSLGALLQVLVSSLFPETPRAVNVLLAYNHRPVVDHIPLYRPIVLPFAQALQGVPNGVRRLQRTFGRLRQDLRRLSSGPWSPLFVQEEVEPLLEQSLEVVNQLPALLDEIATAHEKDAVQSYPVRGETVEACRRMYRARRTLLVQFAEDTLDESKDLEKTLKEANTIMRMKRPLIDMEVDRRVLRGTHLTPVLQLPVPPSTSLLASPSSSGKVATLFSLFTPQPSSTTTSTTASATSAENSSATSSSTARPSRALLWISRALQPLIETTQKEVNYELAREISDYLHH
eukprot:gene8528-9401_t